MLRSLVCISDFIFTDSTRTGFVLQVVYLLPFSITTSPSIHLHTLNVNSFSLSLLYSLSLSYTFPFLLLLLCSFNASHGILIV
jgi:hypothetical protein